MIIVKYKYLKFNIYENEKLLVIGIMKLYKKNSNKKLK